MKSLLLSVCFFALATYSFAQGKISGTVTDEKGEAMPYVNVLLLNAKDSTLAKGGVTDTEGKFVIDARQGNFLVSARMTGYKPYFSAPFELTAHHDLGKIGMEQVAMQLKEVSVTASRPMIEVKSNAIVVNVASSPILSSGSAHDILSKSPGITTDQDGRISLKGKQNVMVMIDGKLTYLSGDEVIRLLQTTPAENIESVEIMENPPAKYDAAGNAGMINIKMKKDKNLGFNGSLNLMGGVGRYGKATSGGSFNYRRKKYNVFGSYNYNYNKRYQELNLSREIPGTAGKSVFTQEQYIPSQSNNHSMRLGTDFFINPKTTIGFLVNGNAGNVSISNTGVTDITGFIPTNYDRFRSQTNIDDTWRNVSGNVNFKSKLTDNSELTIDVDASYWNRTGNQLSRNSFSYRENNAPSPENPWNIRMATDATINIMAAKADYVINFKDKSTLETGVKSSLVQTNNVLDAALDANGTGVFVPDASRSNTFTYDESINAAYMNYSKKMGKWSFNAGLRGEHTASDGYSVTMDQRNKRSYFALFPSASVAYNVDKKFSLSASYSRRIDRPNYQNLNPFVFFLDRYSYQKGNPFLNPQYTDAYSLTYGYKGFAFLTLSYNDTRSGIVQLPYIDRQTRESYITFDNLSRLENYSANLTVPVPVTKWWTMNANLTGFYNRITAPVFVEGGSIDKGQVTFTGNVTNAITLPKNVKLEVTGQYQSKMIWALFEMRPQYQVDLGVSKTFVQGRLKTRASVTDVFKTRVFDAVVRQGELNNTIYNVWENRIFRLNVTYNFGKNEVKPARRRSTGIDDLQRRLGDGN